MAGIQSAINSMIGSASKAVMAVKGYQTLKAKQAAAAEKAKAKQAAAAQQTKPQASVQQMAAERAKQSATDAVIAKANQRRNFMEYLKKQPSNLGTVGDLPENVQKKIAKQYTPRMRKQLMDKIDQEAKNGQHK